MTNQSRARLEWGRGSILTLNGEQIFKQFLAGKSDRSSWIDPSVKE